jgi:hypothetical protein
MGQHQCPNHYPNQHVYDLGTVDTRSCGPCGCQQETGGSCLATDTLYSDVACQNSIGTIANDAACHAMAGAKSVQSSTKLSLGKCDPQPLGGKPQGNVFPNGAQMTVCCQ